jgi:hypothetical protein
VGVSAPAPCRRASARRLAFLHFRTEARAGGLFRGPDKSSPAPVFPRRCVFAPVLTITRGFSMNLHAQVISVGGKRHWNRVHAPILNRRVACDTFGGAVTDASRCPDGDNRSVWAVPAPIVLSPMAKNHHLFLGQDFATRSRAMPSLRPPLFWPNILRPTFETLRALIFSLRQRLKTYHL